MRLSVMRAGVVALVALYMTPMAIGEADGPSAAEIARRCVHEMGETTKRTCEVISDVRERGIRRIVVLAREGAPPRVLHEVASETSERVRGVADEGRDRVNRIAARCLGVLRDIGAPDRAMEVVREARARAVAAIGSCARRSSGHVWRVFRAITSDRAAPQLST
ncbi:MAG: hypothetical protein ACF8GE_08390 [Phycisphaerales bacterium JB043]